MATTWPDEVVSRARAAMAPLADAERAAGAFAYMKGVAPFLGLSAPERRRALKAAWQGLGQPSSDELGAAAVTLMQQREREFHYAAADLLQWHRGACDADFLARYGEQLVTSTPWWDSVDALVSAMVSPLVRQYGHDALMDEWSRSGDRWLVRAALGHQRGWKQETDVKRMLSLCHDHWQDREFFIAKAIGWALRDLARLDPTSVREFLEHHDERNRVAIREARRGLATQRG